MRIEERTDTIQLRWNKKVMTFGHWTLRHPLLALFTPIIAQSQVKGHLL